MYLSYIDTSGCPEKSDPENFVVVAVIIHDSLLDHMNKMVQDIKTKYFPNMCLNNVEFHVKDMLNHTGIYREVSIDTRYSILDDLFAFISAKKTDLKIIGTITDKQIKRVRDIETFGYISVFERFNRYLAQRNGLFKKASETPERGIAIIDTGVKDQKLRSKLVPILKRGTPRPNFSYLQTDLLFINSKSSNLIQVADCISYCIRKYHRRNNIDDVHLWHWQKYYSMLEDKVYSRRLEYDDYWLKMI